MSGTTALTRSHTPAASPASPSQLPPIRVLIFDHTAELGGGEIALSDMIRHFDPARVAPAVLLAQHGPLEALLAGRVPVTVLPLGDELANARRDALASTQGSSPLRSGLALLAYIRELTRFLRDQHVEVLHTNSLKASVLGGIAGRLAGCQVVWHLRDRIADDYLPHKAVLVMRLLGRTLPHFVIGNSRATVATLHLPPHLPTAAIPSGVDLTRFHPAPLPAEPVAAPLIGLVGRICPWKGQHIFIQAAALVHQRFPHARFQIIGAALFGEHDYDQELHNLVRQHGLEDVVEFLGFRKDVPALIEQLTVLVHASVTGEPFGQVIVQGMACAKPVVATDGGGVPESVLDGVTGLLVPMGSVDQMATAIEHLLANPAAAREMGLRGRERVESRFTVQQTTRDIMAAYEEATHRHPKN